MRRRLLPLLTLGALVLVLSWHPLPARAGQAFNFNWQGSPASPQPWKPTEGFDLVKHDGTYTDNYDHPYPIDAQHGADCAPFQGYGVGGTHPVLSYDDLAFICNNHLMTTANGGGYAETGFMPAQFVDFSAGTATVTWKVSTLRASCRDWLSFNLFPFEDNLIFVDGIGVDLYHEGRNEISFTTSAACQNAYFGTEVLDFAGQLLPSSGAVDDVVDTTSVFAAANRQQFELDISRTHVRFGMPAFGLWFTDADLPTPLPFDRAVMSFNQHSYSPDKECDPTPTFCHAATWHWSDLSISPSIPFTILEADRFQVSGNHLADGVPDTVNFTKPSPANSFLRFEALGNNVAFSVDGGQSWITPTHQELSQDNPTGNLTDGQSQLFFWPIPAGVTSVKFSDSDVYWSPSAERNIAIWSPNQ